jgi:hypothetical protein
MKPITSTTGKTFQTKRRRTVLDNGEALTRGRAMLET